MLQARMGSARLPGKVLAPIGGRSVLAHCIGRLQAAKAGPVVVATTTEPEDAVVEAEAAAYGVPAFRGPALDVLARFAQVAERWGEPFVIRATADNAAVDIEAPGRVLDRLAAGADYVVEAGLPVGAAVEGLRADALRIAAAEATAAGDREHVTPFVKTRPGRFRVETRMAPPALERPDVRLTIDTRADLAFMRRVLAATRRWPAPLAEILEAADRIARAGDVT